MLTRVRDFFSTFLLPSCSAHGPTAATCSRAGHDHVPRRRRPAAPLRGLHALRRYPNGRGALHRLQAVRSVCPALAITIESEQREDGSRAHQRYDIDLTKCIFCGLRGERPVDSIVEPASSSTTGEARRPPHTRRCLLAVGDRYEQRSRPTAEDAR